MEITRRQCVAGLAATGIFATLGLAGCGESEKASTETTGAASTEDAEGAAAEASSTETAGASDGDKTITVAASPTPHAEILNGAVKPLLEKKGYTLVVKEFTDYVLPNTATEEGEVDANYFQHIPYLDSFNEEQGTHLVSVAAIHFEPFALYGGRLDSLDKLEKGSIVAVPNDTTNEARALLLLEQEGLLTLKEGAGITATTNDIAENPQGLEFKELEAAVIPSVLADVDVAAINGNYALDAGLTAEDQLAVEATDSLAAETYKNVIVVKEGNEDTDKTKALVECALSDEVRDYINDTFAGFVLPVF